LVNTVHIIHKQQEFRKYTYKLTPLGKVWELCCWKLFRVLVFLDPLFL
jgi:hypothetical protein